MEILTLEQVVEIVKNNIKKVESVSIHGEVFSLDAEVEVVRYCGMPAIYMGDSGGYHYIMYLQSGEFEYKLCDGDFERDFENGYIKVADLCNLIK